MAAGEGLKLLYREAGVLILDEPTAVLTPQLHRHVEGCPRSSHGVGGLARCASSVSWPRRASARSCGDDGVTQQLIHPEYPAFATPEAHRGMVWTRAAFSPLVFTLPMTEYLAARVIAIEMELSTLPVFAALRGLRAGGVLVIDGDARPEHPDPSDYDPHRDVVAAGVARATRVALDALIDVEGAE